MVYSYYLFIYSHCELFLHVSSSTDNDIIPGYINTYSFASF